jgi:type IV secretory pathway component VirB8
LRKAESSLVSLEQSFAAYRLTAEQRISRLENQNRLLKWGFIAAGVLATGLGISLVISR